MSPENCLGSARLDLAQSHGEVKLDKLDNILEDNFPDRTVYLIKLDIEGHEFQALEGARETLLHSQPLVYLECKDIPEFQQLLNYFRSVNYSILDCAPGNLPNFLFCPNKYISNIYSPEDQRNTLDHLFLAKVETWQFIRKIKSLSKEIQSLKDKV